VVTIVLALADRYRPSAAPALRVATA